VIRLARAISMLLAAVYLAGAALPCPPPVETTHAPGVAVPATRAVGPDGWCAPKGAATSVSAVCPCGCGAKPVSLGARAGAGIAEPRANAPDEPRVEIRIAVSAPPRAPSAPVRSIDHVPLFA